jgi:hypothetical protein
VLIGIAAPHGIKNDLQKGDLRSWSKQTTQSTTPAVKPLVTPIKAVQDDKKWQPSIAELKQALKSLSAEYNLDYDKLEYTVQHESSFDVNAKSPNGLCVGLSQFEINTWLENCSKIDDRRDGLKAIKCMVKLWARGEQWRWDAFCLHWYDEACVSKRGLYPK